MKFTHPELYRRLLLVSGLFETVQAGFAGDMKVEQTFQRVSKGPRGHFVVGETRNAAAVAEFELLFHEIGSITSLLDLLTTNKPMDHTECHLQHALSSTRHHTYVPTYPLRAMVGS